MATELRDRRNGGGNGGGSGNGGNLGYRPSTSTASNNSTHTQSSSPSSPYDNYYGGGVGSRHVSPTNSPTDSHSHSHSHMSMGTAQPGHDVNNNNNNNNNNNSSAPPPSSPSELSYEMLGVSSPNETYGYSDNHHQEKRGLRQRLNIANAFGGGGGSGGGRNRSYRDDDDNDKYAKAYNRSATSKIAAFLSKVSAKSAGGLLILFALAVPSLHLYQTKSALQSQLIDLQQKLVINEENARHYKQELSEYKADVRNLTRELGTVKRDRDNIVLERDALSHNLDDALHKLHALGDAAREMDLTQRQQPNGRARYDVHEHVVSHSHHHDAPTTSKTTQLSGNSGHGSGHGSDHGTITEHAEEIEKDPNHHPMWDGLSEYTRMAAIVLGYNKHKWDNDKHLPIFDKHLHELSDEERSASTLLWLDDLFKPVDPNDPSTHPPTTKVAEEIVQDPSHHPNWNLLSQYSRMAAIVLGYDKDHWDEDWNHDIKIYEKTLKELTDEELEAARFLFLTDYFKGEKHYELKHEAH